MLRASIRENGMRVWVLATLAACVVLTGCGDKPVPPFASAPFSVARKGNVLSIPFEVPPTANLTYSYMLAFKYEMPETGDPTLSFWSHPQGAHLFLKVKLVAINADGSEEEMTTHAYHRDDSGVQQASAMGPRVVNVNMHGASLGTALMEVVHFTAPRHGHYRFDVETLRDVEVFEPIISWLTVEREYAGPK
ncbi:hypothetical protein [Luteibacter yeojuensis]|uniref:DUF5625 domain-containing protein n=1 Tax=Luteibacter yeojuensis TaxID=345309 RepID=A0A0F3L4U0_9GAMM|nr:hypothetical protein [Luteibacter yeojuensis]KJV37374.1 hypothetical protein VI08_00765 [Luteibacter yeojuensis]